MVRSTFSSFYAANSALNASQRGLDVTGQNIQNVNTRGYSRQRVDLYSISSAGSRQKYASTSPTVGGGVTVGSISQARDPYLDIRFRNEQSDYFANASNLDSLKQLENIFNEVNGQGIGTQLEDMISNLQNLSLDPTSPEFNMIFRSSVSELCKLLNNYSNNIDQVKEQALQSFKDGEVKEINKLLENIATINQQISQNQLHNVGVNELLDHRNVMLDELSTYLKIETTYESKQLPNGNTVTKLNVNLLCADGSKINLVNDDKSNKIDFNFDEATQTGSLKLTDSDGNVIVDNITDNISTGSVKGFLDFINGEDIYGTPPTNVKGIKYYENMLDTFASKLADVLNNANVLSDGTKRPLLASREDADSDSPTNITAKNITIAQGWLDNSYGVTTSKVDGSSSGANDNILNIISLLSKEQNFTTTEGNSVYKGAFTDFFTYTSTTLGTQINNTEKLVETREIVLTTLENDRMSVSSVSLDEEALNMMVFQKSYNAAARYMTTLDQALDTIINGMGLVGR